MQSMKAPVAPPKPHRTTVHGVELDDPWHWLRDPAYPDVKDPEILAYLEAENRYFDAFMAPHMALVDKLFEEIKGRWQQDEEAVPYKDGAFEYQWRFEPGGQYRIWSRWPVGRPEQALVLLDEPSRAAGHDHYRLGSLAISPDAKYLAWSEDTDGSERYRVYVKEIATDRLLADSMTGVSGGVLWAYDNETLLYLELTDNWRPYRARGHVLGTPNADDFTIYEETDDAFFVKLGVTQSEAFILVSTGHHDANEVYWLPSDRPREAPSLIAARRENHQYSISHHGDLFYILTNDVHRNFRVVTASVSAPNEANWRPLIDGSDRHYLLALVCFRDQMVIEERVDGLDRIRVRTYDGDEHLIPFPEPLYDAGLGTNAEYTVESLRIGYESMVTPHTVFDYELKTRTLVPRKVQVIPSGYDKSSYTSTRLDAPARDGARIPVSIVHRRDVPLDGSASLYLYGYGAYGVAMSPGFGTARLSLLDRGFVFAIAHVRGGDELGYAWYEAGKLDRRENTFNDFVDVARFMIEAKYTAAGRIAISGGSAGGELVCAVVNQSPELWGVACAHVPFVDVLNTMLDDSLPLTPIEWPQWGNPRADRAAFDLIRSYSPYEQLTARAYPPMLVTAGLNDPRVTYWEPAKYVAKLRTLKTDPNPLLFKINMGAGHGGKSGRFDALYEVAEEYAFVLVTLGLE
jgi:oligopeptidase B